MLMIKNFIELHIHLIESNSIKELYQELVKEDYTNNAATELTHVLNTVGINTDDVRKELAYDLMNEYIADVFSGSHINDLHEFLCDTNNLYGYTVGEFVDLFVANQHNLGVTLVPLPKRSRIYLAVQNYKIVSNY